MNEIATTSPESPPDALIVIATNPVEMAQAQQKLLGWVHQRILAEKAAQQEADTNLANAKKNKWRSTGFARLAATALRRVEYYEKMEAALEAGYVIVPNMPIDVFAIRTEKNLPRRDPTSHGWGRRNQTSEAPALGHGEYRDATPLVQSEEWKTKNAEGKEITKREFWNDDFQDVDFPIKAVKPRIIDETARALTMKIFDELGVLPDRRVFRRAKHGDPMVIGQIVYRPTGSPHRERRVSFLLAWWIGQQDLEI